MCLPQGCGHEDWVGQVLVDQLDKVVDGQGQADGEQDQPDDPPEGLFRPGGEG